jgi:integrase
VISRRQFLQTVSVSLLAAPLVAGAQQARKVARVGFLGIGPFPSQQEIAQSPFVAAMKERGWVEGQNLVIERRFCQSTYFGQEEGPALIATGKAMFPRWSTFIMTGLLTGLRWGESAALYKTDIDWKRGRIHVQRTWSEQASTILPCKDSESRYVKASAALLTALRAQVEAVELEGQVKQWDDEARRLVFPTPGGHIVRHGHFIESVWQPLLSKAGLPYRKYHATRHTYATWLLEDGADLRWVQQQMGHASIEQTAGTYGHCQPERHESAADGLDRYLTT